jgi:hypothetical protein
MPPEEETGGGASWRRRTPAVAASVLLLMDSHPLVLQHMVRPAIINLLPNDNHVDSVFLAKIYSFGVDSFHRVHGRLPWL